MKIVEQITEERRNKYATTIQKHWRGYTSRRITGPMLKSARKKQRAYHRLRRAEDGVREEVSYRYWDFVGMAPILGSDTMEEKVMKRLMRWRRGWAAAAIRLNLEYLPGTHGKGVPKRGFGIGREEDLLDQARRGGRRLPGYVFINQVGIGR